MANTTIGYNSLYRKLMDGRAVREFPDDYFGPVNFQDGNIVTDTVRWKKVNMVESYYEWILPYTRKFELVPDYMNGVCRLYPDWYIVRIISRQKEHVSIGFDGIYDLSSASYTEVYIDAESGSQVAAPKYKPSPSYKWSGGDPIIREQPNNIITKIIPVSLSEKEYPAFRTILDKIERGVINLPRAD